MELSKKERIWINPSEIHNIYSELKNIGIPYKRIQEKINNKELKDTTFLDRLEKLFNKSKINGKSNIKFSSRYKLTELLGIKFGRLLYPEKKKKSFINRDILNKLEFLLGKKILHKVFIGQYQKIERDNDAILAEFIGICLGDGNLLAEDKHYGVRIILDFKHDPKYVKYVSQIMKLILKRDPAIQAVSGTKVLSIWGNCIPDFLISKGLIPGDKVKNQIGVPKWIKDNDLFAISCLKGLIDTDGSIHIHKKSKGINIKFSSASYQLISDFKEICGMINVKTGNIINSLRGISKKSGKKKIDYNILISSKKAVNRFIEIINPQKWKYRANILGLQLIALKNYEKWKFIKDKLNISYPDGKTHWNLKYENYLKDLCILYGYDVSHNAIENAIFKAFEYKKNRI